MKKIFILFAILALNLSFKEEGNNYETPLNVNVGESFQNIEKSFPYYHFKFYKKSDKDMSFAMLGYWNKNEGCVLQFNSDTLVGKFQFLDFQKYEEYITNKKENDYIVINQKNINL